MKMNNEGVFQRIKSCIKTSSYNKSDFLSELEKWKKYKTLLSDDEYSFSPISVKKNNIYIFEVDFEYDLFQLYCFFDYSIHDIYELIHRLSSKYVKSDLDTVDYAEFERFSKYHLFNERKKKFLKSSDVYQDKIIQQDNTVSSNIDFLIDDYEDTVSIIGLLNENMKDILNDEDVSSEKRIDYLNKYSKISNRLNDKRFLLLEKIEDVKL